MWAVKLLISFLLIGCIGFGGGYAVIPVMEREIVTRFHLLKGADLANLITFAQVIPGPIAVNSATLIGFRIGGALMAILATLALILPPGIITFLTASLWEKIGQVSAARAFLDGLKPVVVALVLTAGVTMVEKSVNNPVTAIIMLTSTLAILHPRSNPGLVIAAILVISLGYAMYFAAF